MAIDDVISIHALVKRATSSDRCQCAGRSDFNPRPREEGDVLFNSVVL